MDPEPPEEERVEKLCTMNSYKYPNLELAFYIHYLRTTDDDGIAKKLMEIIKRDAMTPLFDIVCEQFVWCTYDESTMNHMQLVNFAEISILDQAISDARERGNMNELNRCYIKKAEYCSKIGDKYEALACLEEACEIEMPFTILCDTLFHVVRIGMFFLHYRLMRKYLDALTRFYNVAYYEFNWERKNRLKIYEGVYRICARDFKLACALLIDVIPSFTIYEVMSYARFMRYTVYLSIMNLPRTELKKKIIDNYRVNETLSEDPVTKGYLYSFYHCNYAEFFSYLAIIEQRLREDYFFHLHYQYYIREVKIVAYKQLLVAYKSLALSHVADQFGVTKEYIEEDFVRLISSGRLNCQINKLNEIIEINILNEKNRKFRMVIKQGDLLLNKVEKLRRVIDL